MDKQVNERSRTAAADNEDGADHIGNDTPRSGFATPEPDPHDKRLPGIMSYFGQVRPSSLQRLWSGTFSAAAGDAGQSSSALPSEKAEQAPEKEQESSPIPSQTHASPVDPKARGSSEDQGPPLLPHEKVGKLSEDKPPPPQSGELHPYPTPPASSRSSMRGAKAGESNGEVARAANASSITPPSARNMSASDLPGLKSSRPSVVAPVTSVAITESSVLARHFSNPSSRRVSTSQTSPIHESFVSVKGDAATDDHASVRRLKELTSEGSPKSGQSTPTRSLSTAQPARNDGQDEQRPSRGSSSRTGTNTPTGSSTGTSIPAARGKLTIKISEARGLKKCRVPYVVVVFQRSELISGGPRPDEEDDETAISNVAMGGVPIQRQPSDSGRIPMAIPMRSRQSSNTSVGEFNSFRNRTHRRSFTNPKWDAEAVL